MSRIDGGPAFARSKNGTGGSAEDSAAQTGMSLRDWFAGQALAGFIASWANQEKNPQPDNAARWAYDYADAMLVHRAWTDGEAQEGGQS